MLTAFAILCLVGAAVCLLVDHGRARYTYDPDNKWRRFCKACGQRQEAHAHIEEYTEHWWEAVGAIRNTKCNCHKDTK